MTKTLLLADDSVTIQKVVGITFANEDVELITVDDGDEALIRARELRPDAILADVSMPGLDGYALCAEIKRDPSLAHIPVLLLTGTFEPFDAARAGEVHPDGHIAKPFEAQVLIDQVFRLLAAGPAPAAESLPAAAPPQVELQPDAIEHQPTSDAPLEPLELPSEPGSLENAPLDSVAGGAPDATRIFDPRDLATPPRSGLPVATGKAEEGEFGLESAPDLMPDGGQGAGDSPWPGATEPEIPFPASEAEPYSPVPVSAEQSFGEGADSSTTPLLGVEVPPAAVQSAEASFDEMPPDGEGSEPAEEYDETPITPFLKLERDRADFDELPELDALPEDDLPWLEPEPEPEPDNAPGSWTPSTAEERPPEAMDSPPHRKGGLAPADSEALRQVLEKMAWEAFGPLTERLVTDVVRKVEEVAWEVIPELAERLIRAEIERLKSED